MGIIQSVWSSLRGLFPGSTGAVEDLNSINNARIQKYRANWSAYWGADLNAMRAEDGTPPARINFLKRNIDKVIYFAFGKGYAMTHPRYQKQLDLAALCWGPSVIEKLTSIGQQGSVTGDAFVMVAPKEIANKMTKKSETPQTEDKEKTPAAQLRIVVIPSEYCTPYYDPFDRNDLESVEIRVPFQRKNPDNTFTTFYQYMKIDDAEISYGVLDSEGNVYGAALDSRGTDLTTMPNPIKSVYVVHIRNFPGGSSLYGFDDITEAAPLNKAYTERLTDIGAIVSYHSAPITCVYGAKAGNLVRGPNKIWGNLPSPDKAKVEHLELKTDLKAANDHLHRLKEGLHELTGVPEIAQGSQQAISNTSGVALHTMYLPLIERAETKQQLYGPHFIEISILSLRWCQQLNMLTMVDPITGEELKVEPVTKESSWNDIRQNTTLRFESPLPKDKLIDSQVQSTLVTAKLQSRRQAMIELGVRNPDKLLEEIAKESAEAMKEAKEMLVAQAKAKAASAKNGDDSSADAAGDESVDANGTPINSGAGAAQGVHRTESGAPRGRPNQG